MEFSDMELSALERQFEEESLRAFQLKTQFEEVAQRVYGMERQLRKMKEIRDATTSQHKVNVCSSEPSSVSASELTLTGPTGLPSFLRHAAKRARVRKTVRADDNHLLSNVTVALVRTEGGVNIGQICRMAANLGVTDIRLVDPQCDHTSSDGRRYAHHAQPLLASLPIYTSVEECAADCDLVIGSSARDCASSLRGCTFIEPQEVALACAKELIWGPTVPQTFERASKRVRATADAASQRAADSDSDSDDDVSKAAALSSLAQRRTSPKPNFIAAGPRVCILFGNEATGLTHAELSLSRYCIYIPTRGAYPSLNLAHAVTTVLFSIWLTGHPHLYWPHVAPTGLGIGSGQFDADAIATLLGVTHKRDAAQQHQTTATTSYLRSVEATKMASRQQVERLRVILEATMHRWGYKNARSMPHVWHETTLRLARTLTGNITEGDAKLLFGLLKTFNEHPLAQALEPLEPEYARRSCLSTDNNKNTTDSS